MENNKLDIIKNRRLESFLTKIQSNQDYYIFCCEYQIAKYSIIYTLLKNEFEQLDELKKNYTKIFSVKKNYIDIMNESQQHITIISYEEYTQSKYNKRNIKKILNMNINAPTLQLQAKKDFYKTIFRKENFFCNANQFKKIFPSPTDDQYYILNKAKELCAPFMYVKKAGIYNNVFSYDIKSAFPATLYKSIMPIGIENKAYKYEEIPANKWYIAIVRVRRAIPLVYDFFGLLDKYIENQKQPFKVYFTKDILESIEEFYDIDFEVKEYRYYKLQKGIFDKFIYQNIFNECDPFLRKINKAKNNFLIGSFGTISEFFVNFYELNNDKLFEGRKIQKKKNNAFLPLWLYVNGLHKVRFCRFVQDNFPSVIYANTDGIFSTDDLSTAIIKYNAQFIDIGKFELRNYYLEVAIKEISNYSAIYADKNGEIHQDMRLSGRNLLKDITHEEFVKGGFKTVGLSFTKYGFLKYFSMIEKGVKEYEQSENNATNY